MKNNCKHCGAELDGEDVYEALKKQYPLREHSQLLEWAKGYGWTKEKPIKFRLEIGVECPDIADGMVYFICPNCQKIVRKGTYWDKYVEEQAKMGSNHVKELAEIATIEEIEG